MNRTFTSWIVALAMIAACEGAGEEGGAGEADTTAQADTVQAAERALYERLGGEAAIRSVVDDLVARAAADDTLNFTRKGTPAEWEATPENIELLKTRLVQFIGQATGGPLEYEGRDMATAHAGMQITDDEFNRLGRHLEAALDAHGVAEQEKQELMMIVETTRSSIVTAGGAQP